MKTLVLHLSTDSDGVIIDGNGHEIADLWAIDKAGKMRVTEESEAAMRERAAEIVLRCNLHDELVASLRAVIAYPLTGREIDIAGARDARANAAALLAMLPEGR